MKKLPDDPRFRYVDLHHTNLRVTFARVRREMAESEQQRKATVTPIKRKTK